MRSKLSFLVPLTAALFIMLGCGAPSVAVDLGGGVAAAPTAALALATPVMTASSESQAKQAPEEPSVPQTGAQAEKPVEAPVGLTISDFNTVPPDDAAREMYVYGQGGYAPDGSCEPFLYEGSVVPMQMPASMGFSACWPDADRTVKFTVISPDRGTESVDLPVYRDKAGVYVYGSYQVDITRQPGRYIFRMEGQSTRWEVPADVTPAGLPVLYEYYPNGFHDTGGGTTTGHLVKLAGFASNEKLRLWAYEAGHTRTFIGWRDLTVDGNGNLIVQIELPAGETTLPALAVTGPSSGEVHQFGVNGMLSDSLKGFSVSCPGALPQRLKSGTARAVRNMNLREQAGLSEKVAATLKAGEQMVVEGGPYCVDERWWWVVTYNGEYLNAAESSGANYLLEMVP